jgi:hypothetical protein
MLVNTGGIVVQENNLRLRSRLEPETWGTILLGKTIFFWLDASEPLCVPVLAHFILLESSGFLDLLDVYVLRDVLNRRPGILCRSILSNPTRLGFLLHALDQALDDPITVLAQIFVTQDHVVPMCQLQRFAFVLGNVVTVFQVLFTERLLTAITYLIRADSDRHSKILISGKPVRVP